jgi:hypothetical protein
MHLNKWQRVLLLIVISIVFLVIPIKVEMFHLGLYYLVVSLLIVLGFLIEIFNWRVRMDERFYKKWSKYRKKGYWPNAVREGLRGLVFIVSVVSLSQYIFNDLTPLDIITKLSGGAIIFVLSTLLMSSFVMGLVAPYEQEKRYKRISNTK